MEKVKKSEEAKDKVHIKIDRETANRLKALLNVGETYTDKIKELLNGKGKEVREKK